MISDQKERISSIKLSKVKLPLLNSISDAKVIQGKQAPLVDVDILLSQINTSEGRSGLGFSYALRIGGEAQFAHATEIAPLLIGEDPSRITEIWDKLVWASASIGRSGLSVQSIAAFDIALWDLKARKARVSLAKLIGSPWDSVPCYNTSGGYLQAPVEEIIEKAHQSRSRGIAGVKIKIGQDDVQKDYQRVEAVRKSLGDEAPIMVDVNQQWKRKEALNNCLLFSDLGLTWIEEPLDAHDFGGHAQLSARVNTPIATGEMLSSAREHFDLMNQRGADIIQPDAPRVGGITPFLKVASEAERLALGLAPHFVMEIHIHLAASSRVEPWIEHFEWLEPLFNERLQIKDGRIVVPTQPGLGLTISDRVSEWTQAETTFSN